VLVGRDRELAMLRTSVKDVAAGRGGVVLVEGEPGVGKSALLASGLADAAELGCRLLWGSADELARRFPLCPLLEGLDAAGVGGDRRTQIDRTLRGAQASGVAVFGGGDAVAAACEQLLALVDELCAASPVVLVVDDLHWADEATVVVWHRLAQSVNQIPLLVAGAARPVPARDDVAALRRGLEQHGRSLITLDPLDESAVMELVAGLAGAPPGPNLTELAAGAAGNPMYVTELVEALHREHALRVEDGLAEAPPGQAPSSLGAAIARRVAFLTPPTREIVQTASLLGTSFTASELATVAHLTAAQLAGPVREAATAGILTDGGRTLAFRHPLIHDALYRDVPASLREALHRDAARALVEAGTPADRVAAQLLHAGQSMDAWTLDWLTAAGPILINQAVGVAADLLHAAVDSTPASDPRRNRLAARLAIALFRAGRSREAEQVARAALANNPDPDLTGSLYAILADSLRDLGRDDDALTEIDHALATPGLSVVHTARLQAMAAHIHGNRGNMPVAERAAESALVMARVAGDRWAIGYVLNIAAVAQAWRGRLRAAIPLREQALAGIGTDPELTDLRLRLQTSQADTLADLDRFEEALPMLREVRRLTEQTGNLNAWALARAILARVEYETGRWDDVLVEIDSPAESTDPSSASYVRGIAALIALHRDDEVGARRHIELGNPATVLAGGWHDAVLHARAVERERAGRPDEGLALLVTYVSGDQRSAADWVTHMTGVDAVRLAVHVGDLTTARELAAQIEVHASGADAPSGRAALRYCRGLIEADPVLLSEAADVYREVGRLLPLAQTLEAAADLHARAGDTTTARRLFTEMIATYTRLGAVWDLGRADAHFRALGIRRGYRPARPATGPNSLTPTETKIASLVAHALSNPQIADRLFLSRRTVEVHVSHILTKLDLHSRIEIARRFAPG